MFDGDCCDKVMQGGKEDINKSVFKIMSGCLMKKEKKCGNQFIFCIYTIFFATLLPPQEERKLGRALLPYWFI